MTSGDVTVTAPCAYVKDDGTACLIPAQYPYRDRVMVCHLHNPAGLFAGQHPNFRRKLERQLDAAADGQLVAPRWRHRSPRRRQR